MDYENLHDKTIFDFTDDPEIIDEIMVFGSKADYLQNLKDNPENNGFDLAELAEMTGNKELAAAVEMQYRRDFDLFFNE